MKNFTFCIYNLFHVRIYVKMGVWKYISFSLQIHHNFCIESRLIFMQIFGVCGGETSVSYSIKRRKTRTGKVVSWLLGEVFHQNFLFPAQFFPNFLLNGTATGVELLLKINLNCKTYAEYFLIEYQNYWIDFQHPLIKNSI